MRLASALFHESEVAWMRGFYSGPEGQMVDSKSGKNKHEAAFCVRFSPDSQFFAVSYADGTVRVCNADLQCAGDAEARTAPSGIPDVERAAGLRAVQSERQRVASASSRFVGARHNPPPPRLRRLPLSLSFIFPLGSFTSLG